MVTSHIADSGKNFKREETSLKSARSIISNKDKPIEQTSERVKAIKSKVVTKRKLECSKKREKKATRRSRTNIKDSEISVVEYKYKRVKFEREID